MLYHASPIEGLDVLKPHVSNHGQSLLYLSKKRENVLVYLSNAVEKHCRDTGFVWNGPWKKWASYGFTKEGVMVLEEYYPNALEEVYRGVSGYLYSVEETYACQPFDEIRDAYIAEIPLPVLACERIEDAYEAILQAESMGQLVLKRCHQMNEKDHIWLEKTIRREYEQAQNHADYRWFLQSKFSFLNPG